MSTRVLRSFLKVAESQSLSAAATSLFITQPALSRQIRALERDLHIELFDRTGGRLALSAAGRRLIPAAMEAVAAADRVDSLAATLAAGRLDRISIASPLTVETDLIAPFVATFGPKDPIPHVERLAGRTELEAFRAGVDMFVSSDPGREEGVEHKVLCDLPVWVYVSPAHPWADRSSLHVEELVTETVVTLRNAFKVRRLLDQVVENEHLTVRRLIECESSQIAQALVSSGRGVAVLTDEPRFNLRPLRLVAAGENLMIRMTAGWPTGHHASVALSELASRLGDYCDTRYSDIV